MLTVNAYHLNKELVWGLIANDFWSHVDIHTDENGCWPWKGVAEDTYPAFHFLPGYKVAASHMALLLASHPKPNKDAIACHTCDYPPCVRPTHLYWGTAKTNSVDAYTRDRRPIGSSHPNAKLDEEKVLIIRQLLAQKVQHKDIAKRFGVKPGTISSIASGYSWKSTLPKQTIMGIDSLCPDPV